jgi:hypothetical protein
VQPRIARTGDDSAFQILLYERGAAIARLSR